MDLTLLQTTLRQFAAQRHWAPFHTPKNLAMALMVEAAELAEIFQWMTPAESQTAHRDPALHEQIADEVADVLLYLLQLADHSAINIAQAVRRKLLKNAAKHPAPGARPAVAETTQVLLDWDSAQPTERALRELVPALGPLWVLHASRHRRTVAARYRSWGERLMHLPVPAADPQALDFQLAFYLGHLAARSPRARLLLVSNEPAHDAVLEQASAFGLAASRVSLVKG